MMWTQLVIFPCRRSGLHGFRGVEYPSLMFRAVASHQILSVDLFVGSSHFLQSLTYVHVFTNIQT